MSDAHKHDDKPWSVPPHIVTWIVYALYAICALSVLLEFVIHRHEKLGFAGSFGFYAWYGFVACVGLVLAAKVMRRVLMRDEDYYSDEAGDGDDYDTSKERKP